MPKRQIHAILPTPRTAVYTKYALTKDERKALIDACGDSGFVYYQYLVRMAQMPKEEITDAHAADYFGWSVHKAKRTRIKLIKAGWFDSATYKIKNNLRGVSYYIGPQAVEEFRSSVDGESPAAE